MVVYPVLVAVLFILIIFLNVSWCLKHYRVIQNARKFPTLSGNAPVFGHLFKVLKYLYNNDVFTFLDRMSKEFLERGVSTGVLWVGPVPVFVICDPKDAKLVYETCLQKSYIYGFASPWIGEGLISCTNLSTWKKHRKLLTSSFNLRILSSFVPIFNNQSKELVKRLSVYANGEYFDPKHEISVHSMGVLSDTVLGKNHINVSATNYSKMVDKILGIIVKRTVNIFYHLDLIYRRTKTYEEQQIVCTKLRSISKYVLAEKTLQKNKENSGKELSKDTFKPFMDVLLDVRDKGLLDEVEIQDELNTFIAAGYETAYSALLMTISILGQNQDIQEKIYQEIINVVGNKDEDINPDHLKQLVYLDAVIKEILRLYPIIMIHPRTITATITLGNITTVTGEQAFLNKYAMGRHKSWGPDAEEFKPERWLRPNEPIDPNLFTAFSLGRRDCIGKSYAMLTLKTSTALLVRSYKITQKDDLKLNFNFLLKPDAGNKIALEKRLS